MLNFFTLLCGAAKIFLVMGHGQMWAFLQGAPSLGQVILVMGKHWKWLCFIVWLKLSPDGNAEDALTECRGAAHKLLSCRKAMSTPKVVSHSPGYCSLSKFFFACSLLLFSRASFQRLFSIPGPRRHFLTLHFVRWTVSGQAAPPNWGSILIILVLIMWPLPQEVLHSDHWDHSVSSQSMAAENKKCDTKSTRSEHKVKNHTGVPEESLHSKYVNST